MNISSRWMRFALLAAFVLVSNTALLLAQGSVNGTVAAPDGTMLGNVSIGIKNTLLKTRSLADGSFRFENVAKGAYTLVFLVPGQKTLEQTVSIEDGQTAQIRAQFSEKATRLGDITVYGATKRAEKLAESPAAISTATPP